VRQLSECNRPQGATPQSLIAWRRQCEFRTSDDWVFASRLHNGRKPYWGAVILRHYIQPAAERLGIEKRIGWHTFRHTYSTLLRSLGVELLGPLFLGQPGPARYPCATAAFSSEALMAFKLLILNGVPDGIRTRVTAVKVCPTEVSH
jgi:hypothetical protein